MLTCALFNFFRLVEFSKYKKLHVYFDYIFKKSQLNVCLLKNRFFIIQDIRNENRCKR